MITHIELRKLFLDFFEERGHKIVPSAPLVPEYDPTLLFTSAGMVQFKKFYSGETPLTYKRAVSVQKCLRADEEVGKYQKYNTFFEMLGNFSFGDYFKEQAIIWAWEFIAEALTLDIKRLYITVFKEDNEAFDIWHKKIGIEKSRIYRFGKGDNFWGPAGKTGPCGPCSEIFYDMGKEVGCGKSTCKPGCDCDRFIEIWNLVFPQYNSTLDGELKPLKNRGIDTGMGLERTLAVCEGVKSIFETSLFRPIIARICEISKSEYEKNGRPIIIIADHIRALTFALSEGIYPSNEKRGYVIRKILRRAQMAGKEIGLKDPFLYKLSGTVIETMKGPYPELQEKKENIALIIKSEEESFLRTLNQGEVVFNEIVKRLKKREISGEEVFRLYDTYGFPPELTEEMAKKRKLIVSWDRFKRAMEKQKKKARESSEFKMQSSGEKNWVVINDVESTEFVGYDNLVCEARIARWREAEDRRQKTENRSLEIILDRTPFYAESGGQVGDKGKLKVKSEELKVKIEVIDTRREGEFIIHYCEVLHSTSHISHLTSHIPVICEVDAKRRKDIGRNHTGTHLLHAALRKVIGKHVHQEGSLVDSDRFRFDFTHFAGLKDYEIAKIEELVNEWIRNNLPVRTYELPFDKAIKKGAIALFGEKYGDLVRVVEIEDISTGNCLSMELCGGTHVKRTGEIGLLKIAKEEAVHAGIRRVEVLTGKSAFLYLRECESNLISIAKDLNVGLSDVRERISKLREELDRVQKEIGMIKKQEISGLVPETLKTKKNIMGIDFVMSKVSVESVDNLRLIADKIRASKNRVGVLVTEINKKPVFISFVSDDLKERLKAGDIAREIGKITGGGGGGKPHLAQSGGKDIKKIQEVFSRVPEIVKELLAR